MPPLPTPQVLSTIEGHLGANPAPNWSAVLSSVLASVDCPVGTLHLVGPAGDLVLTAQTGLPPPVLEKVARIPIGKGMAGIAAERREPVQVCNLQQDQSGVVRPGAKLTRMEGSIACPILDGPRVLGVLGVAKPTPYEFRADEVAFLMAVGERVARRLAADTAR